MSKNSAYNMVNSMNKVDLDVLHNIYLLRCLTTKQIFNTFYSNKMTYESFLKSKLKSLIQKKLIEQVKFSKEDVAMVLTQFGVDVVREAFDLPTNIIDDKKNIIKRGYYRASELKMQPRLVNHQINLNQFVLDFKYRYEENAYKMVWRYYDEKYVSQYVNIRPDGLIRLVDTDFFLEMDMSTESKAQLIEKWRNYRAFLASREYKYNERRIIVLFIIEGRGNLENRKKVVRKTAKDELLDFFSDDFDLIVGSKEELLDITFNELIPNIQQTNYNIEKMKQILTVNHKFSIASGDKLKKILNNTEYSFYIRKVDEENTVVIEDGKIQEYLLDYYQSNNMSVINKIDYLPKNSSAFKYQYRRDINYIVVCENLNQFYNELKLFDLNYEEGVYFTTIERLEKYPFNRALCQFNSFGQIYSFKDMKLEEKFYD